MKKFTLALLAAICVLGLTAPAVTAFGTTIHIDADDGVANHGIHLDHGDVIIHNDSGGEARITAAGALIIDGKSVPVTAQQKIKLLEYAGSVKDLETHAMKLGAEAAGFALGVVGDVLADLFSGASEDEIDRDANTKAHSFKQKALPICNDVKNLKRLQDELAADIQSFKPFAVIKGNDSSDCEHDIMKDD